MPRKLRRHGVPLWRAMVTSSRHQSFLLVAVPVAFASLAAAPLGARAEVTALAPREVAAKSIPVPTDVSPGMQKFIAAPLNPAWQDLWKTGEEWRKAADKMDEGIVPTIPAMAERLHVKIEPSTMDGVKVFVGGPQTRSRPKTATGCSFTYMAGATVCSPAKRERPRQSRWPGWSISR